MAREKSQNFWNNLLGRVTIEILSSANLVTKMTIQSQGWCLILPRIFPPSNDDRDDQRWEIEVKLDNHVFHLLGEEDKENLGWPGGYLQPIAYVIDKFCFGQIW